MQDARRSPSCVLILYVLFCSLILFSLFVFDDSLTAVLARAVWDSASACICSMAFNIQVIIEYFKL